jgi:uncharacterized protein YqjF (DUF2071 family)
MNANITTEPHARFTCEQSIAARHRMLSRRGEPLFIAGWHKVLMIHLEVDAEVLQRDVPFQLDLHQGRAFVSLVAFTLHGMRPKFGGSLAAWMFRPVATHDFLNVRTYVRCDGEPAIHFLGEWLSNRLAVTLGPTTFGLPYHYGRIDYEHDFHTGRVLGIVNDMDNGGNLAYHGKTPETATFQPCEVGSLDEWLMERYTAFNSAGPRKRFFRVWHPPWAQFPMSVTLDENTLLTKTWKWFQEARLIGANYSPGFDEVWMGRPHFC